MKKQEYKNGFVSFAIMLIAAASSFAQNSNMLPSGKYWLKMKATKVHKVASDQPEHSILVTIAHNANDIFISSDRSKTNISGYLTNTQDGGSAEGLVVSINGTDNWISFKARSLQYSYQGTFVFIPGTGGTSPASGMPENSPNATVGSFTLTPYSENEKIQPVTDATKTKEAYNSTEEWWSAFKKWMAGEGF
jgi:hypothetical protein